MLQKNRWSVEALETYARNILLRENSIKNRVFPENEGRGGVVDERVERRWREFRTKLFAEVCDRVLSCAVEDRDPNTALANAPVSILKLANRYNLLPLAIQSGVCAPHSPLCEWAARRLAGELARAAGEAARATGEPPPALPPARLAPALAALRAAGTPVRCTRGQLRDIWQRMCELKAWQLRRHAAGGDRVPAPGVARLADHDWRLLDALLLHDHDETQRVVTRWSLRNVESYRALCLLVLLLALQPGGLRRTSRHQWTCVLARYQATGRTASAILLQRRWYHLRSMTQAALQQGEEPLQPLFNFISLEYKGLEKERKETWKDIVRQGRYVVIEDEKHLKQERKRKWYFYVMKLEKAKTVQEINIYIKQKLINKFRHSKGRNQIVTLERNIENNTNIINSDDESDSKNDKESNENNYTCTNVNNTDEAAKQNVVENTLIVNKSEKETIEALKRIDPNKAQVTVVFDTDLEDVTELDNNVNFETHDISNITKDGRNETGDLNMDELVVQANKMDTTELPQSKMVEDDDKQTLKNVSDEELRPAKIKKMNTVEDQLHWIQHSISSDKPVTCRDVGFMGENKADSKTVNDESALDQKNSDDDEHPTIDNKLLCATYVKLTRIDESPAWSKHAAGNTIDVKLAGLIQPHRDDNEHIVPNKILEIEDSTTSDDTSSDNSETDDDDDETGTVCRRNKLKPESKDVWESVLTDDKNQILLRMCKTTALRLNKLVKETPRKGRVVKKVELADIDEVRRINKNILTAEVKPITVNEESENDSPTEEETLNSSEADRINLQRLKQLNRDLRALFQLPPAQLQAVMDKAIMSDEIVSPNNVDWGYDETQSSSLFLDEDEEDDMVIDIEEPKDVEKSDTEVPKEVKKKRKKKKATEEVEEEPPPRLTAFEEWERQKNVANKYFAIGNTETHIIKRKKVIVRSTDDGDVEVKQKRKVTDVIAEFKIAQANKERARHKPQPPISVIRDGQLSLQNMLTDNYLSKLLNKPAKEPRVDRLRYMLLSPMERTNEVEEVVVIDDDDEVKVSDDDPEGEVVTPMITAVCSLADTETIDDVADTEVEKVEETVLTPTAPTASWIIVPVTPTTSWTIESTKNDASTIQTDPTLTITPMGQSEPTLSITPLGNKTDPTLAMTSMGQSEPTLAMIPLGKSAPTMAISPMGQTDPSLATTMGQTDPTVGMSVMGQSEPTLGMTSMGQSDPAMTLPSMQQTMLVKTGAQLVTKKFEIGPNVLKVKVSSKPTASTQNDDLPTSTNALMIQKYIPADANPVSELQAMCERAGTSEHRNDVKRKPEKPKKLSPNKAELSSKVVTEFTTPVNFMEANRGKPLTVVKIDIWRPLFVINKKYVILTEKDIPCNDPGYWTVNRNPPAPCQLLVWPKNMKSGDKVNDPKKILHVTPTSLNDVVQHAVLADSDPVECESTKLSNDLHDQDKTIANEENDVVEILVDEIQHTDLKDSEVIDNQNDPVIDKNISNEVTGKSDLDVSNKVNIQHTEPLDKDESDSDCEENKLQIVESDTYTAGEFHDSNVANEVIMEHENVNNTGNKTVNKMHFTDHTYSKCNENDPCTNEKKIMIKVKSFASVNHMETKVIKLDSQGRPDIVEKANRFYKKLVDIATYPGSDKYVPVYAMILSAVTDVRQCDRLLRAGAPLQVLDREQSTLQPLLAHTGPNNAIRLGHYDPQFLKKLVKILQHLKNKNSTHQMYESMIP